MQNKKILVIGGVAFLFAFLVVGFFLLKQKPSGSLVFPSGKRISLTPTEVPLKMTAWKDPLGFTFPYPKEVKLDPHDEDQENYAHVELTNATHSGNIIVWAKDTEFSSIEDWVNDDPMATSASVLDATLAGVSAKKLYFAQPVKKLVTATIYDELLFLIEMVPDSGTFWGKIYDDLLKGFSFGTMAGSSEGLEGEGEVIDEGEEIIE